MNKNEVIHNFEIIDIVDLNELNAKGIWARHKSGAQVFHVLNDDPENLFAFAFSTAPQDSTGVSHILEHSVLCGSERYPLKDAFAVLAQGSLQTFLNAWTFSDKTVYPASSVNEKDYFNLMAVYADAVFRPLLSEWTFMQEGWRLVPGKRSGLKQAGLEYTGVVYNEMKGAYSNIETYAGLWSVKAVMPDTPYAFESGGDPDTIPTLSYEALKDFHRERYAPANCRVFLAGNIPTEKQFEYLDTKCLAGIQSGLAAAEINKAKRWDKPASIRVPCPGTFAGSRQAILSWLCIDAAETIEGMALACLGEILLGHDGSPLTRALVESGLGEDMAPCTGIDSELRESVFSVGLRGIKKEHAEESYKRMEALILQELKRLADNGIPKQEIEAAFFSLEFTNREIKRPGGPYSLVLMRRSLRSWLYGARPWDSLLFVTRFDEVKERYNNDNRYFESLIKKYLLDNPHRALIAIEGEEDYYIKKEAERASILKEKEKQLSGAEKKRLKKQAAELERIQSTPDTKEALNSIPHLSLNDLEPLLESVPTSITGNCMTHGIFTNGITYAQIAFPVDVLEPQDYFWLSFFSRAITSMGLPGMDYGQVSSLMAGTMGNFIANLETGSVAPPFNGTLSLHNDLSGQAWNNYLGRDWIVYHVKSLDEKIFASLDLAKQLITQADFSDLRRLRDLAIELKNDVHSSIAPNGSNYASGKSSKLFSRSRAIEEIWHGLEQVSFAIKIADMDMEELKANMERIRGKLLQGGVLINLTADNSSIDNALKAADIFSFLGAAKEPNSACRKEQSFYSILQNKNNAVKSGTAEVYASPSLQVGFAAMTMPCAPYGSREQAAEYVFSHEMSTGALWESIRMMGGAYGAYAHPDSLERNFSFTTYRDPNPLRSLEAIPAILKQRGKTTIDKEALEKSIIGTFAKEITPRTPADKGFSEFIRRLYGITDEQRLARQKNIISLNEKELSDVANRLASAASSLERCSPVIITEAKAAQKAAKKLGVEVIELPV